MKLHLKLIVAFAASTLAAVAGAQTTDDRARSSGEANRDASNAVGRAASAAVTPGDQNMGRTPENRSGGLMGNDRTGTGSSATDSTRGAGSSAGEATRDATNGVGRAGSAAVTPGDQNMGRTPENRNGGLMGNDRSGTSTGTTDGRRLARADRG